MMMIVTVSIKWINVKANLVLSCLGLFPVSLPVLLCRTDTAHTATVTRLHHSRSRATGRTKEEKNKKRETETRFTNTIDDTLQY